MKLGAGAVFVAIGLLVLWFAITGRLSKFVDLWQQASGDANGPAQNMSGPGARQAPTRAAVLGASLNIPAGFPALPGLN